MSCSSEGCSTSAPGRQPERVLGEITDITLFSPGKKKITVEIICNYSSSPLTA